MVTEVEPRVNGDGMVTVPVKVGEPRVASVPLVGSVTLVAPVVVNNKVFAAVPKGIIPLVAVAGV